MLLPLPVWAFWAGAGCLVSVLFTRFALRYARARQLLDLPGHRRSHTVPTPRGGGVAIVATLLAGLPWLQWGESRLPLAVAVALILVAGIGWLDDHRSQSARVRFLVHLIAAILIAVMLWLSWGSPLPTWPSILLLALAVFWLAGCINVWNFMDGANGLVTSQCLWLGLVLAVWFGAASVAGTAAPAWSLLSLLLAGACLGFLPFNFPRAAIFLGDVGSGALGLVCGLLLLVAMWMEPQDVWLLLLLPSALLVDAGMTLAWRIISGRRWYTAHREHLYQWLIRSGYSHARVALCYMAWNLLVVLPACLAIRRWPSHAMPLALSVLAVAVVTWWLGKRSLCRQRRFTPLHRRVSCTQGSTE